MKMTSMVVLVLVLVLVLVSPYLTVLGSATVVLVVRCDPSSIS